jgi:hypothetical protein
MLPIVTMSVMSDQREAFSAMRLQEEPRCAASPVLGLAMAARQRQDLSGHSAASRRGGIAHCACQQDRRYRLRLCVPKTRFGNSGDEGRRGRAQIRCGLRAGWRDGSERLC